MNKIIKFPQSEPELLICNCGCLSFRFYSTGKLQCASCETWMDIEASYTQRATTELWDSVEKN